MSHVCRLLPHGLFAALALAASAHASAVGPGVVVPEVRFQHEIAYVLGGVGSDECDAMRVIARRLDIRLNVVSTSTGEALSDVDVSVMDDRSKPRLRVHVEGPLLYMRLPHGHYQIMVVYRGVMQTVDVSADTQSIDAVV